MWAPGELQGAVLWLTVGCIIAFAVFRLVPRVPWPRPLRWQFVAVHALSAPLAATLWFALAYPIMTAFGWGEATFTASKRLEETLVIGCIFYVLVAGISYSAHGAARAAQAESVAAQTQLATLRSQLQPHFLFNALHTIVQLIHVDPERATEAAELVAELLRRTLEEQRDEVPLSDEWRFVSRYLAVEQIRFGERLVVTAEFPPELQSERVPSFALQTLVENAVQHGAAPRVAPTDIVITATRSNSAVVISVRNSGDVVVAKTIGDNVSHLNGNRESSFNAAGNDNVYNSTNDQSASNMNGNMNGNGTGTGLARLRERLSVLYGGAAALTTQSIPTGGFEAVLTIPRNGTRDA